MDNQERAEKIIRELGYGYANTAPPDDRNGLGWVTSQLDEAVADAVREAHLEIVMNQALIHGEAAMIDGELIKNEELYKQPTDYVKEAYAEGFASAKEKAAGIAEHATAEHGCYLLDNCNEPNLLSVEGWIAERIRSLKASDMEPEEKR